MTNLTDANLEGGARDIARLARFMGEEALARVIVVAFREIRDAARAEHREQAVAPEPASTEPPQPPACKLPVGSHFERRQRQAYDSVQLRDWLVATLRKTPGLTMRSMLKHADFPWPHMTRTSFYNFVHTFEDQQVLRRDGESFPNRWFVVGSWKKPGATP